MRRFNVTLNDVYKGYQHDQDKLIDPRETVNRLKTRLAGLKLDILEKTVRIDTGRLDIPVYFSRCGQDAWKIIGNRKQMGKGATPKQAEASAVMELAERFSLFSFRANQSNFKQATYRQIGDEALDFETIARSVNDTSDDLEVAGKIFEKLPLQWTWAFSLTNNRPLLIPFNWFYAINEYNGSSAGNCPEEALVQGISEVVERHVSALVCRSELKVPLIDKASIEDRVALELLEKFEKAGVEVFLSDLTLGTGIPTVSALAWDPATFPAKSEIVWTAGTMPSPVKALCRALTEVAQLGGDFNTGSNYVASGLPKFKSIQQADFLINPSFSTSLGSLPDISDSNIKVEVENLVAALAHNNMEVMVVDILHPELQVPAYYTIVPGAEFRERAENSTVAMLCAKLISETLPIPQALARLEEIDQTMPGKYYISFYLGKIHSDMGNSAQALEYMYRALDHNPPGEDAASIYSYIGICFKNQEKFDQALDALNQGEKLDPERTDIYNLMGYCYFKKKQYSKAVACFEKVLDLDPGSAIDYANLAVNYRALGQTEKAIGYYRLALELDDSIDFARQHLQELEAG